MITITYEKFMMALALFTALCVAGGWVIKIVHGIRKPGKSIKEMLDNDNKKIGELRTDVDKMEAELKLLLKANFIILGHLQTGNNTGNMAKMENEIQQFLINN